MNRDDMLALRDYYDTHSAAGEMESGHWETEVSDNPNISISLSLPKDVLDKLRKTAREQRLTVFTLVRAILEDYVTDWDREAC